MEDADRTDESADDMTAAETAPKPKNETKSGVRYCNTIGNIMLVSCSVNGYGPLYAVSFQAERDKEYMKINLIFEYDWKSLRVAFAIAPMRTGGIAIRIQPKAATYERIWALPAVLLDNTRWK